ncbi:MAG: DUF3782 domain-containing protein [Gemmatimonadota bacterium]|nr:DUF3782 domain-containing protein [Gemmatimonadota bacterium]
MRTFSDEELIDLFNRQLPDLLDRRPDLEPLIYQGFLGAFARREEVAVVLKELRELRTEMNQRFEQVDARIDVFRKEVDQRFDEVSQAIDRLGSRWGIRNESVFRRTMAALLEESFGAKVEERVIAGEQFDVVIVDADQYVLVEIAASVGATIQERLERKRRLYTEATGVAPARVLLATADIYSYRAQSLREAGIEVIEPAEAD